MGDFDSGDLLGNSKFEMTLKVYIFIFFLDSLILIMVICWETPILLISSFYMLIHYIVVDLLIQPVRSMYGFGHGSA
jgi:hypothetical protein